MDFRDTPEEAAFRKEVRDWLEANLDREQIQTQLSVGPPEERIDNLRAWQGKLHEGGWAGVSWPKEYGGRRAALIDPTRFYQKKAAAKAPAPHKPTRPREDGPADKHERAREAKELEPLRTFAA